MGSTFNILSLWYLVGIYLVLLGVWLFLDDGDIFIGFLWVIDLGVGLVFFIFILHYSTFTQQKINLDKSSRALSISFFSLINLMLFYGIVSTILTCFMIKRIFSFLNVSQYLNYKMLYHINATYFIRNQNFIKQQAVSTGTGV